MKLLQSKRSTESRWVIRKATSLLQTSREISRLMIYSNHEVLKQVGEIRVQTYEISLSDRLTEILLTADHLTSRSLPKHSGVCDY